jgi:hypothetical protein
MHPIFLPDEDEDTPAANTGAKGVIDTDFNVKQPKVNSLPQLVKTYHRKNRVIHELIGRGYP